MRAGALALGLVLLCAPVQAATHCVAPGGGGGCFASVQAAVDAAASGDTISIAAGTYVESVLIAPRRILTLTGGGSQDTIIDGDGGSFVLGVTGPGTIVSLSDVTVRNADVGIRAGGARLNVRRSVIRDNAVNGILDGCAQVPCGNGSLRLAMEDSTVTSNGTAGIETNGAYGVGISLTLDRSRATISRCTISDNTGASDASIFNGAIYVTRGPLVVTDSTVSGNSGIGVEFGQSYNGPFPNPSGIGSIIRSTIAGNRWGVVGNGVFNRVKLDGSILADNTTTDCDFADDAVTSRGFNLIETGCDVRNGTPDLDLTGVDPALGPLQDNGGPTETHALLAGSPALGAIDRAIRCRRPDQRGVTRAVPCDIGAYEAP